MIQKTDNGLYVISSRQVWKPGVYATEGAARYAFRFDDEILQSIQDKIGNQPITIERAKEDKWQ